MDDPAIYRELYDLAAVAAERQVKAEHVLGRPLS
jgi:hypothetical protein